jgi:hypothetical protein
METTITVGTSRVFKYTLQVTVIDMLMYIHINGVMYIPVDIQLALQVSCWYNKIRKSECKAKKILEERLIRTYDLSLPSGNM